MQGAPSQGRFQATLEVAVQRDLPRFNGRWRLLGTQYLMMQIDFSTIRAHGSFQAAAYFTMEAGRSTVGGPFRFHAALHCLFHGPRPRGILGGLFYQAVRIFYNLWPRSIPGFVNASYLYKANFRYLETYSCGPKHSHKDSIILRSVQHMTLLGMQFS